MYTAKTTDNCGAVLTCYQFADLSVALAMFADDVKRFDNTVFCEVYSDTDRIAQSVGMRVPPTRGSIRSYIGYDGIEYIEAE
jgi:hypothetical protein